MAAYDFDDTIVALATPPGRSALALIRTSGPEAITIADRFFQAAGGQSLTETEPRRALYGHIVDEDGESVDQVILTHFRAPNSSTGEDSVEITTHGSPLLVQQVIALLLGGGMRGAEPGEFTFRAFENGKLDLAQAEAVADVIDASSTASLRGARRQLDGHLSAAVNSLRSSLTESASLLELELDFSEQHLEFVSREEQAQKLDASIDRISKLLQGYRLGQVIREGIHVALVGRPNVGKSSLLNYLLREPRAIVSHIPGTTRDIIREQFEFDGVLFIITDTAGLRESEDQLEREGIARSHEIIEQADLVLVLGDPENDPLATAEEILHLADDERILPVLNKADLAKDAGIADRADRDGHNREATPENSEKIEAEPLWISALEGSGIETMLEKLKAMALGGWQYSESNALVLSQRHHQCLSRALEALLRSREALMSEMSNEFIALDMREALEALGEIIGEVDSDAILNSIFRNFCVGK